ncbi:MAG: proprotein convertase P-domain-containing protein [Sedimentisphaerales bacterium]|nr:proprotein convertase P-domain-containing protein [Sedimentisphaerales bacterium]
MRANNSAWMLVLALTIGLCQNSSAKHTLTYGGKFDLAIPGGESATKGWMADAVIDISEHVIISDLDIVIDIKHSQAFDLNILLQGPGGAEICLNSYKVKEYFIGEDYLDTVFDDEAGIGVEDAKPPFAGTFRPKEGNKLSIFDGIDAFGIWRLRIEDLYYADTGRLNKFELKITVPEPVSMSLFLFGGVLSKLFCRKRI